MTAENGNKGMDGESQGKRQPERPSRSWETNIKMNLKDTGWEGLKCFDVAQNSNNRQARLNTVMNIQVPQQAELIASHEGLCLVDLVSYSSQQSCLFQRRHMK
jgi:hypothetical protein